MAPAYREAEAGEYSEWLRAADFEEVAMLTEWDMIALRANLTT